MQRYLSTPLNELLGNKFVLLTGPRQVGKTTLAKSLSADSAYYNYDIRKDWGVFRNSQWDRDKKLVIFDELHKMKKWKLWLKGLYDEGLTQKQKFLVTGSARLDIARKMGDSLAGRFFSVRFHPLDLKELRGFNSSQSQTLHEAYTKLLKVGGFPEPYFQGTDRFYNLWSRTHNDIILRQDLISLTAVRDLDGIANLAELLAERVGSTISFSSLAQDLQRDDKTIKQWLGLLEQLYVVFRVNPYAKNIVRGLKKAGKYYFYDCARVRGEEPQKLENLVALALKKEIEFQEDINGVRGALQFIQTKEKNEIDFLVTQNNRPAHLIEVKLSDASPSRNFHYFSDLFPKCRQVQLVLNLDREYSSKEGIEIRSALDWLAKLDLG
ncbi:MAG: ATP-binding protein [Bdellovibrio sp.]|nr:ATP-binding protein [Bdellovibrio sp.]